MADGPRFEGSGAGWEALAAGLRALPCFRTPTEDEIDLAFDRYDAGDAAGLVDGWRAHAEPSRAVVTGIHALLYGSATLLPRAAIRASFLATVRMVLAASHRFFDEQLAPETARTIRARLDFLEHRHLHVPPGYTPPFSFPREFAAWVAAGEGLDARVARFQLAAVLNEVQQSAYSHHFADRFGLPEIHRHAELERGLAIDYARRFAPPVTRALLAESLWILDGLNAAVFAVVTGDPVGVFGRCLLRPSGWRAFVAGLGFDKETPA